MAPCGRCGLNLHYGACRAINAKCLKCHRFGHFARVCRTSNKSRSLTLQVHLKKKRDTERMTAFLRRKDAANLPFNGLCSIELQRLCFNSILRLKPECGKVCKKRKEILQEKVSGLEASVSFLRIENGDIKTTIKSTANELEQIKKENKEIKSASRRKDNRVKQFIAESEKNLAKIERLEKENENLHVELGKSERKIGELESKKYNMDETNDRLAVLSRWVTDTEDVVNKERLQYTERIQNMRTAHQDLKKTNEYQQSLIQKCKQDISGLSVHVSYLYGARNVRNFSCRKCGSTRFHDRFKCPAISAKTDCIFCQRNNHFSVFCNESPID